MGPVMQIKFRGHISSAFPKYPQQIFCLISDSVCHVTEKPSLIKIIIKNELLMNFQFCRTIHRRNGRADQEGQT